MKKHHIEFYSSIIIIGIESGYVNWGLIEKYNSGYNHSTGEQHEAYVKLRLDDPEYAVIPVTSGESWLIYLG